MELFEVKQAIKRIETAGRISKKMIDDMIYDSVLENLTNDIPYNTYTEQPSHINYKETLLWLERYCQERSNVEWGEFYNSIESFSRFIKIVENIENNLDRQKLNTLLNTNIFGSYVGDEFVILLDTPYTDIEQYKDAIVGLIPEEIRERYDNEDLIDTERRYVLNRFLDDTSIGGLLKALLTKKLSAKMRHFKDQILDMGKSSFDQSNIKNIRLDDNRFITALFRVIDYISR